MTDRPRRRYRVRLRKALAGSVFAAAAAASLTGLTAAPALAAPARTVSASSSVVDDDAVQGLAATPLLGDLQVTETSVGAPTPAERLAGVRADLDRAVLLRLVTSDQAETFYLQIERRVAAGL